MTLGLDFPVISALGNLVPLYATSAHTLLAAPGMVGASLMVGSCVPWVVEIFLQRGITFAS